MNWGLGVGTPVHWVFFSFLVGYELPGKIKESPQYTCTSYEGDGDGDDGLDITGKI